MLLTVWERLQSRFGTRRTFAVCELPTSNVLDIRSTRYSGFRALFETQETDYSVAAQFQEGRPLKKTCEDGRRANATIGGKGGCFGGRVASDSTG